MFTFCSLALSPSPLSPTSQRRKKIEETVFTWIVEQSNESSNFCEIFARFERIWWKKIAGGEFLLFHVAYLTRSRLGTAMLFGKYETTNARFLYTPHQQMYQFVCVWVCIFYIDCVSTFLRERQRFLFVRIWGDTFTHTHTHTYTRARCHCATAIEHNVNLYCFYPHSRCLPSPQLVLFAC